MHAHTVTLLKECSLGIEMGVGSIDEVLPHVKNPALRSRLTACKHRHEQLEEDTLAMLTNLRASGKEPGPMAKSMAMLKTNFELAAQPGDETIASLMTDGCNMGVKSITQAINENEEADERAKVLAAQLVDVELGLAEDLRAYL